ncbi:hypothetical protein JTB14_006020 [Gonioctena quinquepunctata]|nr:hypothetical protein JTB14_006020 [Gonioctena quinquepunctata]
MTEFTFHQHCCFNFADSVEAGIILTLCLRVIDVIGIKNIFSLLTRGVNWYFRERFSRKARLHLREDNVPASKWTLALVIGFSRDNDKVARVGVILCRTDIFTRPLVNICSLPET